VQFDSRWPIEIIFSVIACSHNAYMRERDHL